MKQFSVIIPTMWKSDKLATMLEFYESNPQVAEVILIDNAPPAKIKLKPFSKVSYHTFGKNIFVNPAWNYGAAIAKHRIILANDDIILFNFAEILEQISLSKFDIVGISTGNDGHNTTIKPIANFPAHNYGCFMYVRNYQYIPDQFKIWYGDNLQFMANARRGVIINPVGDFDESKTVNSALIYFCNIS